MSEVKVAVVGASGYAGAEAVRLLLNHPMVHLAHVTSARSAGQPLQASCPWLDTDLVLEAFDPHAKVDVFFLCQETGFASEVAPTLESRAKVIDFSADFRLVDAGEYQSAYGKPWPNPRLKSTPVYGLPELTGKQKIAQAQVVANPGCYPTASLLALMPLVERDLVEGVPVIDGKSGVSGAGRSRQETEYLFSELEGNFKAYKATGHRHIAEMVQMAGMPVRFTPHLLPLARGMEATVHVPLKQKATRAELLQMFTDRYANDPFVRVQEAEPMTKQVLGSNACVLTLDFDERTGFAVVRSVIDNLGKGAAGQAVQSMNLMFGLSETTGLSGSGLWP
jgi:N-acetyl-gamma-glutamyl-phosphate reductase